MVIFIASIVFILLEQKICLSLMRKHVKIKISVKDEIVEFNQYI